MKRRRASCNLRQRNGANRQARSGHWIYHLVRRVSGGAQRQASAPSADCPASGEAGKESRERIEDRKKRALDLAGEPPAQVRQVTAETRPRFQSEEPLVIDRAAFQGSFIALDQFLCPILADLHGNRSVHHPNRLQWLALRRGCGFGGLRLLCRLHKGFNKPSRTHASCQLGFLAQIAAGQCTGRSTPCPVCPRE